jgi:hypothetical protein
MYVLPSMMVLLLVGLIKRSAMMDRCPVKLDSFQLRENSPVGPKGTSGEQ